MLQVRRFFIAALMVTLAGLGFTAEAQRRTYGASNREIRQIIQRIESRTDVFRASVDATLDRSRIDGTRAEDDINSFIRDFENATDQLRDRFNNRQAVASDVQQVLDRAAFINSFMQRNRLGVRAERDWASLRTDLNELARLYSVTWNWNNQTYPTGTNYPTGTTAGVPYRVSEQELRQLITRIENRADRFRTSIGDALNDSRYDGSNREDRITEIVQNFETATNRLRDNFNSRQSTTADVQEVLNRAARIDRFMRRNQLNTRAENNWSLLRTDLNTLASYYNVAWNWDANNNTGGGYGGGYGSGTGGGVYSSNRLTGTYRLDTTRSDDARDAAERATRNLPYRDRQRILDRLTGRLEAPDQLAIDRRGRSVTIASTRSPQITFDADGRVSNEQSNNGRTARVTATLNGDQLVVSSTGTRDTDFSVTFDPIENGRRLRVTRRISDINLTSPVVVQSTYDKISEAARFDIYTGPSNYPNTGTGGTTASGDFIVPNGTTLVATLSSNLTTRDTRDNDRFTMTVVSPSQFDGAVIEGYVSNVSRGGRISGRSGMTLNFDSIRLRNGQSYRFAGILETVRTSAGETVRVDNEGAVQESDSRGSTTAKRAGIGTAVGAIIGAIAGGGKGAAIGAIIGAGAGAGSVYVQGQDDLELLSGTEVTVRSTGPNNR